MSSRVQGAACRATLAHPARPPGALRPPEGPEDPALRMEADAVEMRRSGAFGGHGNSCPGMRTVYPQLSLNRSMRKGNTSARMTPFLTAVSFPVKAGALLAEEDGATKLDAHQERHDKQKGREQNQSCSRTEDIHETLEDEVESFQRKPPDS